MLTVQAVMPGRGRDTKAWLVTDRPRQHTPASFRFHSRGAWRQGAASKDPLAEVARAPPYQALASGVLPSAPLSCMSALFGGDFLKMLDEVINGLCVCQV